MQAAEISTDVLSEADYTALAELRHALRTFSAFSEGAAKTAGLPPQQHQALLAIRGWPEDQTPTIGALAERLLIAPHTATELVGRLVEAGLVAREADAGDRRRHVLKLTEKSETILAHLSKVHLREIRDMAPRLIGVLQALAAQ
jgi:DNA-binding MarR family transcriptional regulator